MIITKGFAIFRHKLKLEISWTDDDSDIEVCQAVLMLQIVPVLVFERHAPGVKFRLDSADLLDPTFTHTMRKSARGRAGRDDLRLPGIVLFANRYLQLIRD